MSRRQQHELESGTVPNADRYEQQPEPLEVAEPASAYRVESAAPELPGLSSIPSQVARQVLTRLDELEAKYAASGLSLGDLGSVEELADRMIAAVPSPSPWSELGPFYTTSRVAKLLGGISRQAVADRRARHTLLALKTAEHAWVYPEFQFDEHNDVLAGLPEILKILSASEVDEWTLASWLTSRLRSLADRSPIDWLRIGGARDLLVSVAQDTARRFAR